MFDIIFGWRKASKCKRLIRRVQCRLKLLKNKRSSIVRQLRDDVGQLLRTGYEQIAFHRVDHLVKDQSILTVYELLDHFCEFIIINLPYIRRNKDCPNDINEAVSTLIFASARFGDLPELRAIRELFGERYGQRFAVAAVELLPGNLVNSEVIEKLSMKSVPDNMKHWLMDEIAREYFHQSWQGMPLALEYSSELQQQQAKEEARKGVGLNYQSYHWGNRSEVGEKIIEETENEAIYIGASLKELNFSSEQNQEKMSVKCTAEHPSQLADKKMIYLNDIEEFQSKSESDGSLHDQRVFVFKSVAMPVGGYLDFEDAVGKAESWNENASSRRSIRSWISARRSRKRTLPEEKQTKKDSEFVSYYGKSCRSCPSDNSKFHHKRKHHKKMPVEEEGLKYQCGCRKLEINIQPSKFSYSQGRLCCSYASSNEKDIHCSLEHPCYFCTADDTDVWEISQARHRRDITDLVMFQTFKRHFHLFQEGKPNNVQQKWPLGGEAKGLNSTGSCATSSTCSSVTSPWASKDSQSHYMRTTTMQPGPPKDRQPGNITRSITFPSHWPKQSSNVLSATPGHVHPKLPDYTELEAKFTALKKAYLQSNQ